MTRQWTKRFFCIDCAAPVGRDGTRCVACRKTAKSAWNKDYQRQYHAEHRPSPTPQPQRDLTLPSYGEIVTDDEKIQCHCCGKWYGSLVGHIKAHGLNTDMYKERYDLPRTASLLGPAATAKFRANALARNQGEIGRANIPTDSSRPKGLENRLGSRIVSSEQSAKRKAT
ncbi:MAG: MucR family transcriptional regulator [Thermomicrobiales bacterium]